MQDLSGQNIVVVGLGSSGRAAVQLALLRGANVTAVDRNCKVPHLEVESNRLRTELGPHQLGTFLNASRIIVSPGVPSREPILAHAITSGVPVIPEIAFAAEVFPKSFKIAAVTGTNGKSTVTSFTGQILRHGRIRTFVGGNLGAPFSEAACRYLSLPSDNSCSFDAAVVEVSSYQLELPSTFAPSVGAILNLTPDHLERHNDMETYGKIKCRLFSHMGPSEISLIPKDDYFLRKLAFDASDHSSKAWIGDVPGVQFDSVASTATALIPTTGLEARLSLSSLKTLGTHNAHNAAISSFIALALDVGVDANSVEDSLSSMTSLPHRMEIVAHDKKGVLWVNDSKATNIEATYAGLKGVAGRRAIVLLGGLGKVINGNGELGFKRLVEILELHKGVVIFGVSGKKIEEELNAARIKIPCVRKESMSEAVQLANAFAEKGDIILLSPACASFDEFDNFEHRGRVFSMLASQ